MGDGRKWSCSRVNTHAPSTEAVAHTGMNNTLQCLCRSTLAQDVSHALMAMEIETDCESEKKLSQNEYVK